MQAESLIGTKRYVLKRRLGAGGMGVVFEAFDRDRGAAVALKILQRIDASGILQIKREFRSLAEVSHPNLVTLYELESSGDACFFTMELVDGVDFLTHVSDDVAAPQERDPSDPSDPRPDEIATVREISAIDAFGLLATVQGRPLQRGAAPRPPRPHQVNVTRLRAAFRQLVAGVRAVHAAGKVHRDIKPTNVLVTKAGRAVLLDFGLVSSGAPDGSGITDATGGFGTPEYMAPEQALGAPGNQASDWYAVGTVLYESLVGRLPFVGSYHEILRQKFAADAPSLDGPSVAGAEDLAALAMRLLARDPLARPGVEEIFRIAGAHPDSALIASSMPLHLYEPGADASAPFVGRDAQLAAFAAALEANRAGRPVAVRVRGRSGMGKSSLCHFFLARVRQEAPEALVLDGRCYERESVPHKALDGVMDRLVAEIAQWSPDGREAIPEADREALGRLFPIARRLWPGADEGEPAHPETSDARTQRRQAAEALRRLLSRVSARRLVAIFIDDFQWSDVDSLELISGLLSGEACPSILWIFGFRAEDEATSEPILGLDRLLAQSAPHVDLRRIEVEPLDPEASRALALRLLGQDDAAARAGADRLARESAGSPLFVAELARLERERGRERGAGFDRPATLEEVLVKRVTALPPAARRLLDRVAVAGRPIRQSVLRQAAAVGTDEMTALLTLRNGNLVRAGGVHENDALEAYHDRIRELVVATLTPEETRRIHADLATALRTGTDVEALSNADLEAIAYHSLGAGDERQALHFTLRVARNARAVFASRDAVRQYETALRLLAGHADPEEQRVVRREAAEAYRQAGLYDHALRLLTIELGEAKDAEQASLFVRRGHVFQEKGQFAAAISDLESALALHGGRPPGSRVRLGLSIAWEIARHLFGGSRQRTVAPGRQDALERQAETLLFLVRIYYFVDVGKLVWAGLSAMNLARGSRSAVTRVLATGYFGALLSGLGWLRRAHRACERALALAEASGSQLARGVALGRVATVAIFRNDLDRAVDLLHESVGALKLASESWELLTNLMLEATGHFLAGRLERAETLWAEMMTLARDSGDAMHQAWCLAWTPYVRCLLGKIDPKQACAELREALGLSRSVRDVANQVAACRHLAALAARGGEPLTAAEASEELHATLGRYQVGVPFLQIGYVDVVDAAVAALAGSDRGRTLGEGRARRLRRMIESSIRHLQRFSRSYPMLEGPTARARALAFSVTGHVAQAREAITRAITILEASPNPLLLLDAYRDGAVLLAERRAELETKAAHLAATLGIADTASQTDPRPCA